MKIPLTWQYIVAFFCLGALLGIGHELGHHVAGFLVCGEWGYKTFNSFVLAKGCADRHPNTHWLPTLAGPVLFNYLPMWIGYFQMRKADVGARLFGVSLVLATVPIMRIAFSFLGANDEPWVVAHLFGDSRASFWLMNLCIWGLASPPLILAWRTITNRAKPLVFLLFFLGVPIVVFILFGLVLEPLITQHHVLADTVWGMPYMVLLAEAVATLGYAILKPHLRRPAS